MCEKLELRDTYIQNLWKCAVLRHVDTYIVLKKLHLLHIGIEIILIQYEIFNLCIPFHNKDVA